MSKVSGGSSSVKSHPVYRVKNWSSYNRALIARGSLTVWLDDSLWKRWYNQGPSQRGAQFVYSDPTIEWMLTMRVLFGLPLRQTQEFIQSLLVLMGLVLTVPDYSTLSRRQGHLAVALPTQRTPKLMHLMVDSTGLKVYGEGEWNVRQHGWTKRRTWRKLHVGVNEATGEVVAQTLTSHRIDDASQVVDLLTQVAETVEAVGGDGAYDKQKVLDSCNNALTFTKVCLRLVGRDGRSQVSYLDDVVIGRTVDRRVVAWPRRNHRSCCVDAV